jgi:uncharacterized membrane protein YeaQ/YmgE (transglycosylase-associated protein family)
MKGLHNEVNQRGENMGLLAMIITGLIAGLLARALVSGGNGMGIVGTILLGIVGSFVGGFVGSFISSGARFAEFHPTGLVFSTLGAILTLVVVHAVGGRRASAR